MQLENVRLLGWLPMPTLPFPYCYSDDRVFAEFELPSRKAIRHCLRAGQAVHFHGLASSQADGISQHCVSGTCQRKDRLSSALEQLGSQTIIYAAVFKK